MENLDTEGLLPKAPQFTAEELEHFQAAEDFRPALFEWYKYTAQLVIVLANILPESPAFKTIEEIRYYILMGLLNRCGRLMFSNVALFTPAEIRRNNINY